MVTADVPGAESTFLALKWKTLSGFTGSLSLFQTHGTKCSQVPGAILTVDLGFSNCLKVLFSLSKSVTMDSAGGLPISAKSSFNYRERLFLSRLFWWNSRSESLYILCILKPYAGVASTHTLFVSSAVTWTWPSSWTQRSARLWPTSAEEGGVPVSGHQVLAVCLGWEAG